MIVSIIGGALIVLGALAVGMVVAARARSRAGAAALAATSAEPADPDEAARLVNLVENLCIVSGLDVPDLYVLDSPALNAFVSGPDAKQASIVVTSGMLAALPPIELEGVLAQLVSQIRSGDIEPATLAVTTAGAMAHLPLLGGLGHRLLADSVDDDRDALADLAAVALTRYPPGLIAALSRLERGETTMPGVTASTAHLWFAEPGCPPDVVDHHAPLADRIAALREL